MEKRYIVIRDCQGGELGMYRDFTAKEWGEQAYEWANIDDFEQPDEWLLENFLKGYWVDKDNNKHNFTEQDLINQIADMWEIKIVELDKNNKELIDYLESTYDLFQDAEEGRWTLNLLEELGVV